jgi:protein SCO1/2
VLLACVLAAAGAARAEDRADLRERLGSRVDGSLAFTDQDGARVRLEEYFDGRTPVVLSLNYFHCAMLCDVQLARLATNLAQFARERGAPLRAITVSIDPRDTPADARKKRAQLIARAGADLDWSFLVGGDAQVLALARALGASYAYDPRTKQYDHIPALFVFAPDKSIARYLYGIDVPPRELQFAVLEASAGRIGRSVDRLLLRCFKYDPATGRYSVYVLGVVRGGSALLFLAMVLGWIAWYRRERARAASAAHVAGTEEHAR